MKKKHKIALSVVLAIMIVVVAVIVIVFIINRNKVVIYDGIIDAQIDAINNKETDYWVYSENSSIKQEIEFQKYYSEIIGRDEAYDTMFEDYFEQIEGHMGGDYIVSYTVIEDRMFDEKELEEVRAYWALEVEAMYAAMEENASSFRKELSEAKVSEEEIDTCIMKYKDAIAGYENMNITEVNQLNLKVNVKSNQKTDGFEVDILIAKIDGEWVFMQENEYLNKKHYVFSSGITPYSVCTNIFEQY